MIKIEDRTYLSMKEAAELLDLSSTYLTQNYKKWGLRPFKRSRRVYFLQSDLERFIESEFDSDVVNDG